jgi:methylase of polypeptide subunit release factors
MMAADEWAVLSIDPPERIRRIGDVFRAAELNEQSLHELTGGGHQAGARRESFALLVARTGDGRPLSTLLRLFIAGLPVAAERAAEAVAPMALEDWLEVNLLRLDGESVVANVCVEPCHGVLLASDVPTESSRQDVVLGPANASRRLLGATIRRPVARALDIGCGSGVQALAAARHADEVVAVDVNPRAVTLTRLNALLNRLDHVDVRLGSFFEPVAGERFGLIVANPPFVISPDCSYTYRDGDLDGDGVVQTLSEHAGAHLEEGGFFQMVCDWATVAGQPWPERLAGWFSGTGCDVLALQTTSVPIEGYAAVWVAQTESGGPAERSAMIERWLTTYRRLSIVEVNTGILVARRRAAERNWFGPSQAPSRMLGPAGEAIARRFTLRDRLQALDGRDGLLSLTPRTADALRLEQQLALTEGGWAVERMEAHLIAGLAEHQEIDPLGASLLRLCDGQRTVRELAAELSQRAGRSAEQLLEQLVPAIESMLELGFLEID